MNAALQDAPPMHSGLRFGTAAVACLFTNRVLLHFLCESIPFESVLTVHWPLFLYFHVFGLRQRACTACRQNTPLSIYLTLVLQSRFSSCIDTSLQLVSSFSGHTTPTAKPCAMSESHQRPDGRRRSRLFKLRLAPPLLPLEAVLSNQLLGIALVRRRKERRIVHTDDPCLLSVHLFVCRHFTQNKNKATRQILRAQVPCFLHLYSWPNWYLHLVFCTQPVGLGCAGS